jgi:hypothetical protein
MRPLNGAGGPGGRAAIAINQTQPNQAFTIAPQQLKLPEVIVWPAISLFQSPI